MGSSIRASAGRLMEDADWAALLAHRPSASLYGVITTGIICLSGCPARTPLRKNIRLFETVDQAMAAGFRPCKRCKPAG
jgi:AraC family transcriptional regulator, regulatory protein of adaptative response / methylated-DNA-[protein]-cysteine methyltransferase